MLNKLQSKPETPSVPEWADAITLAPDPQIVRDQKAREAIVAAGWAWQVRDKMSGIELLLVPPGEYQRGKQSENDEENTPSSPAHIVVAKQPFYLGQTVVTRAQWGAYSAASGYKTWAELEKGGRTIRPDSDWQWSKEATWQNPSPLFAPIFSREPDPADPVTQVSWEDARHFCDYYGFRLPTEAEWEYAARAGTRTTYWWGDQTEDCGGEFNVVDRTAKHYFPTWQEYPFDDGYVMVAPTNRDVQANPWGFVDILGNVNEWCSNWYDPKFYLEAKKNEPVEAAFDDRATGENHAYRGGCWDSSPGQANAYVRGGFPYPIDVIGFRVARDPFKQDCGAI